jgi:hypothetical protein
MVSVTGHEEAIDPATGRALERVARASHELDDAWARLPPSTVATIRRLAGRKGLAAESDLRAWLGFLSVVATPAVRPKGGGLSKPQRALLRGFAELWASLTGTRAAAYYNQAVGERTKLGADFVRDAAWVFGRFRVTTRQLREHL